MKKLPAFLLATLILLSCKIPGVNNKIVSDTEMSTRVAQILTGIPTETPAEQPLPPTSTPLPPTPEPTLPPATETALPPTNTPTLPPPTETQTFTPSATPLPSLSPIAGITSQPSLTPSSSDPRDRLGPPVSGDPLDNADFWGWGAGPNEFSNAAFEASFMRLTGLTNKAGWRMPSVKPSDNFYVEMTAFTENCSGKDNYGIIFRVPNYREPAQGYLFSVSCDGYYKLWLWDGLADTDGASKLLLAWKSSPAIRTGSEKNNRVGVMATGSHIYLYINGYMVGDITDTTFPGGSFGVFIDPDTTSNFTIRIDEMSYWNNPSP